MKNTATNLRNIINEYGEKLKHFSEEEFSSKPNINKECETFLLRPECHGAKTGEIKKISHTFNVRNLTSIYV